MDILQVVLYYLEHLLDTHMYLVVAYYQLMEIDTHT